MKRILCVLFLAVLSACGSQPAALETPYGDLWQVAAAQNAGSFGLIVVDGKIVAMQDQGGTRNLAVGVPFDPSVNQLSVGFHLDADVFGHGATQPTDIIIAGQKQSDGSFSGIVSIDTDDGPNVEFVKQCVIKLVS